MRVERAWRIRVVAIAAVVGLGATGVVAGPATAGEGLRLGSVKPAPTEPTAPEETSHTITLITGDRVMVSTSGDGEPTIRTVPAAGRGDVAFTQLTRPDGGVTVIPSDAMAYVVRGRIDRGLFDITERLEAGADAGDASFVIEHVDGAGPTVRAEITDAGARIDKATAAGTIAVRASADAAAALWRQLSADGGDEGRFESGVGRISLAESATAPKDEFGGDAGVTATFDVTLKAIGRDGNPVGAGVVMIEPNTQWDMFIGFVGTRTVRVPAGLYDISTAIHHEKSVTLVSRPAVRVNRDLTVVLDARKGKPVELEVDRTLTRPQVHRIIGVSAGGSGYFIESFQRPGYNRKVFATPTGGAGTAYHYRFRLAGTLAGEAARKGQSAYVLRLTKKGIPNPPVFRIRDHQLARVVNTVHDRGFAFNTTAAAYFVSPAMSLGGAQWGFKFKVVVPSRSVFLYSAGPKLWWQTVVGREHREYGPTKGKYAYVPDRRYDTHWNRAAIGPDARPVVLRHSQLLMRVVPFSVGTPDHRSYPTNDTTSTTLSKDGEIIGTDVSMQGGGFIVDDPSYGRYEIAMSASREQPTSRLAGRVDARWTYVGALTGGLRLPTPVLQLSGDFDLLDRAPPNEPFPLSVHVSNADRSTPEVEELKLWASFDDRATWRRLRVTELASGGYRTVVPASETANFVSLRGAVREANGSELEQTVIRAYRIRR